jgi:Lipid A 3-O-deacylase (PagL)
VHCRQRIGVRAFLRSAALALLFAAACVPRWVSAQSFCQSCEIQAGIGGTYHFWGATGGLVVPVTLNWSDSRYELGLFRVTSQQVLWDSHYHGRVMADPYWGMSLSRRFRLFERGPVRGFIGFGIAAKTESDQLSVTRLDFASQLGLRVRFPGNHVVAELTMRHWSNGGIRLPNHGEDFATVTFRLNTGLFGADKAEQIPASQLSNLSRVDPAGRTDTEELP